MPPKAAGAYALALVFIGLGFRRRPRRATADAQLDHLLATIPFGVACWSSTGRLITCNGLYRSRLDADPAGARSGASYTASIRRLIQGGYMHADASNSSAEADIVRVGMRWNFDGGSLAERDRLGPSLNNVSDLFQMN